MYLLNKTSVVATLLHYITTHMVRSSKVSSVPVHILGNPKAAAHVAVVLQCWILYNVENCHSLFVKSKHY